MGVLVLDKPIGPTSFGVVRQVRWLLANLWGKKARNLKVGHGGTLDPLASGVLPICVGEATKIAPFLLDADKAYEATVRFGAETDTLDAAGVVMAEHPIGHLDEAAILTALDRFRGPIQQVPPMYSALKREGRPLHAYARAGEEVPREPRTVTIHALEVVAWEAPHTLRLHVRCSKGTYVRVLAADLGRALGSGAHLTALRRTASGPFRVDHALTPDALRALVTARSVLPWITASDALAHLRSVVAPPAVAEAIRQGQQVPAAALDGYRDDAANSPLRILRADGTLLAVAAVENDRMRLLRVFGPDLSPEAV